MWGSRFGRSTGHLKNSQLWIFLFFSFFPGCLTRDVSPNCWDISHLCVCPAASRWRSPSGCQPEGNIKPLLQRKGPLVLAILPWMTGLGLGLKQSLDSCRDWPQKLTVTCVLMHICTHTFTLSPFLCVSLHALRLCWGMEWRLPQHEWLKLDEMNELFLWIVVESTGPRCLFLCGVWMFSTCLWGSSSYSGSLPHCLDWRLYNCLLVLLNAAVCQKQFSSFHSIFALNWLSVILCQVLFH